MERRINFKLAQKLKEVGINVSSIKGWEWLWPYEWMSCDSNSNSTPVKWLGKIQLSSPTYDDVINYLREKRQIHIYVTYDFDRKYYQANVQTNSCSWLDDYYKSFHAAQKAAINHSIEILKEGELIKNSQNH